MAIMDKTGVKKILETIKSTPRINVEKLASKTGFPERDVKLILQELKRQNIINDEHENIIVLKENIEEIIKGLKTYESRSKLLIVEEIAHRIELFRQYSERYKISIQSTFSKYSYDELFTMYLSRIEEWIEELNKRGPSVSEEIVTLRKDKEFIAKGVKIIDPKINIVNTNPDSDHKFSSVASFNGIKTIKLTQPALIFPITVSLVTTQKAAIIKTWNGEHRTIYDPEAHGVVDNEDMEDIDEYPAYLSYEDKIRVRYSKNKGYLYSLIEKIMQEYSPKVLYVAESVLPPDMWYRDMEKPKRKQIHLNCMLKGVEVANSSKLFDCPIAQVTRSASNRRRETSILTRIAFGLVAESPQEYIKLTERGNFDDIIFSMISTDKKISPCFIINEKYNYLKDESEEKKALTVFGGENEDAKRTFSAYKNLLEGLETAIVFLNYKGAGLRFRFLSYALDNNEKQDWALRIANYGYIDAVEADHNIAYLDSVEKVKEMSVKKADEIFETIVSTLTYRVGAEK